ncbi:MAG: ribosome small subunit-dependent GTPase A [Anaerolineales bacterium]
MIRSQSGFFHVQTEEGILVCRLRGRLKQGIREGDLAAIGDKVHVNRIAAGEGSIESIEPRQRMISRMAPLPRGEYEQIIIANPDQIVLVFACAEPEPHLRMLDRFLIIAEQQSVPAVILANKIDLVSMQVARQFFDHYTEIGYPLIYASVPEGKGLDQLKDILIGKISALAGPSGTGKSSLLNAIQPGLGLEIQKVSETTGKGKHTTVSSELFPLKDGGYVADTPGLKALALWDIEPEELDGYFPDISSLVAGCQFSNCTHVHEPGCAVRQAVELGEIHPQRYDSYLRLRFNDQ